MKHNEYSELYSVWFPNEEVLKVPNLMNTQVLLSEFHLNTTIPAIEFLPSCKNDKAPTFKQYCECTELVINYLAKIKYLKIGCVLAYGTATLRWAALCVSKQILDSMPQLKTLTVFHSEHQPNIYVVVLPKSPNKNLYL